MAKKMLRLEQEKKDKLLHTLHQWLRASRQCNAGILFHEFHLVISKVWHAFMAIPAGTGLMSPCNAILRVQPEQVYLHNNKDLRAAIESIWTLLQQSTLKPMPCHEVVTGWPDYITRVKDASSHGVGGIIVGERSKCTPTVFRFTWPDDVTRAIVSQSNPEGTITNSDLEMAGLLMLFVIMEHVCGPLVEKRVALFSNNSPTIGWVERLASRTSIITAHLIRALALQLVANKCCPLMPQYISGSKNAMTDIPLHSFGSLPRWHFKTEHQLLTFLNDNFPLPQQKLWMVYCPIIELGMQVISVLRTRVPCWQTGGNYRRQGIMLEQLGCLCCTCGSGPFATGSPLGNKKQTPHRICAESLVRILWTRDTTVRA
jgi:hypothetical protein